MEKMKLKKVIAVAGVCAMVTGMIAGCGNNSSDTSSDSSSDSKTEASSDWDASNDISVVSREDGSGTRGAFIELFGIEEKNGDEKVDNTTDEAQITNSTSVMLTTVAGDDYAIGYVSLGALDDSVKAVKIDGAEATADNVKEITKYQDRLTLQQKKEAKANLQKTLSHLSSVKKVRQL